MSPKPRAATSRSKKKSTRSRRARPTPRWLEAKELDEVAQRRTLMFLDVMSGRVPVSDAVEQAKISRGFYYQLETKALQAVLAAMMPGATPTGGQPNLTRHIDELETKVHKLEEEKRRLERLLAMTAKVLGRGSVTTAKSKKRKKTPSKNSTRRSTSSASTPMKGGGTES